MMIQSVTLTEHQSPSLKLQILINQYCALLRGGRLWLRTLIACCILLTQTAWAEPLVDQDIKRIVSLGGGVTETLFALGVGSKIVAVDVSSIYPNEVLQKAKVGYLRATSAEGIASMKPTLVIASEALGPASVRAQLKAAHIKLALVPEATSVREAIMRIKELGEIVGRQARALEITNTIKSMLETPVPKGPRPRVLFLFSHGGGRLMVAGEETAAHTMIKEAGGINAVTHYKGYRPLTAESVVTAQPEVILLTTRSLTSIKGREALWKIPSLSLTPAGKAQRSVVIDDLKLLGFGPRTGEAILELRRAFFVSK